jgi:hypothetical protein
MRLDSNQLVTKDTLPEAIDAGKEIKSAKPNNPFPA